MNSSRARASPSWTRCMRRWSSRCRRARATGGGEAVLLRSSVEVWAITDLPYPCGSEMPAYRSGQPSYCRQWERASAFGPQHEDLERARGVEHDLAVIADHLAPGELLHGARRRRSDRLLEGQPVAAHQVLLARGEQRLLVARQPALHHDEDVLVLHVGPRRLGAAPVVLLLQADHGVRQGGAQRARRLAAGRCDQFARFAHAWSLAIHEIEVRDHPGQLEQALDALVAWHERERVAVLAGAQAPAGEQREARGVHEVQPAQVEHEPARAVVQRVAEALLEQRHAGHVQLAVWSQ